MTATAQVLRPARVNADRQGRFGEWIQRIQDNRARNAVYRRTVRELSDLTNRDLEDLGINRSMITVIARDAAWGSAN